MVRILAAAFLMLLSAELTAQPNEVLVSDGDWKESQSTDPRQSGAILRQKVIMLNTGAVNYGLRAITATRPDRKRAAPVEGYLGMPHPCSENWYHGGFLAIALNGKDIGDAPLKDMRVIETGERGALDAVWDASEAVVRVRFLAYPKDDKLFCEIALEPKTELTSIELRANCYPSFFTSWHKQKGHRVVESPASKVEEGQKFILNPQKDWALIYYDTVFDVAAQKGVGPCALLFLPEQIKEGRVIVGDYAVNTYLVAHPKTLSIRLIFWDFKDKANKDAIAYFKANAEKFQKELRDLSFTNRTLAAYDFDRGKAEAEGLVASAKGTETFAKTLADIDAKLRPICEKVRAVSAAGPAIPFSLEDEALRLLAEREKILWQLKFHVLLSD